MALGAGDLLKLHGEVRQLNFQFYHNVQDKFRSVVLQLLLRSCPYHHEEVRALFFEEFQSVRSLVDVRTSLYQSLKQTEVEAAGRAGVHAYREAQATMQAQKKRNMEECMHLYNVSFNELREKLAKVYKDSDLVDRATLFVKERIYARLKPSAF